MTTGGLTNTHATRTHWRSASWALGEDAARKAEELARLEDFFGRLARGEHRSLYPHVQGVGGDNGTRTSMEAASGSDSGSEGSSASGSSASTPASSPVSVLSVLPSKTHEETEDDPMRGRTHDRGPRERAATYSAQYPSGTFTRWQQSAEKEASIPGSQQQQTGSDVPKQQEKRGRFTFKMMLHDLYEDIESFKRMVKGVLEDSKLQYKPMGNGGSKKGKEPKDPGHIENSGMDSEELGGERAAKKRRVHDGRGLGGSVMSCPSSSSDCSRTDRDDAEGCRVGETVCNPREEDKRCSGFGTAVGDRHEQLRVDAGKTRALRRTTEADWDGSDFADVRGREDVPQASTSAGTKRRLQS